MLKGTVYGGVLYLPNHPAADIHGLLRWVLRTKSWPWVFQAMEEIGAASPSSFLVRSRIWSESGSAIEKLVTESNYGRLMVCPLAFAYTIPERYVVLSKEYFSLKKPA